MASAGPLPAPRPNDGNPDEVIAALASRHHGLVNAAMLRRVGIGRQSVEQRVNTGRLFTVLPRVYLVGHYHWSPAATWQAALLYAGDDGRLIGRSAAEAHGWLAAYPKRITVSGGPGCKTRSARLRWPGRATSSTVYVRRWSDDRPPFLNPDRLATVSPAEVILGVAEQGTGKQLGAAIRAAEYARVVDDVSLRAVISRGRPGSKALRAVLDSRVVGSTFSRTALEERMRDLIAAAGLPTPLTNVDVPKRDPVMNVDFYLRQLQLVIEADGPEHELPAQRLRDQEHDLALGALGITVRRFPYWQIERNPEEIIAALRPWALRLPD